MTLHESDIKDMFDELGVIHYPELLTSTDVSLILSEIQNYVQVVVPQLSHSFVVREPGTSQVRNLYWINTHSSFFRALGEDLRLKGAVAALVDWEPTVHYVEMFAKPARVGTAIPIHQDEPFLCLEPPDFVTLWIALDPSSEQNGGVHYFPGSHKRGSLLHTYTEVTGSLLTLAESSSFKEEDAVCFPMNPGDAVVHHGRIVHYSHPNTSEQSRRGLAIAYRNVKSVMNENKSQEILGFSWRKSVTDTPA